MTGYSRSPKLLKGALIQFSAPMLIPIPNIIIFQYNPESMTRTLQPYKVPEPPAAAPGAEPPATAPQAQPYDPHETFSLNLQLDASDALEVPEAHPAAVLTGVADRLAALEMLLYPAEDEGGLALPAPATLGGGAGAAAAGSVAGKAAPVPAKKTALVLFVWGPGRIVPVRVTSFSVEEQLNNPMLYPLRAKVALGLEVITKDSIKDTDPISEIAKACYEFTMKQKQVLALANLANSVESILGMLPF